jgi:hypothetical protein
MMVVDCCILSCRAPWPHSSRITWLAAMVNFFHRVLPPFFYLDTRVTTSPNPSPTTCLPHIPPNIYANTWPMRTFDVTILCAWYGGQTAVPYGCPNLLKWGHRVMVNQQNKTVKIEIGLSENGMSRSSYSVSKWYLTLNAPNWFKMWNWLGNMTVKKNLCSSILLPPFSKSPISILTVLQEGRKCPSFLSCC